MRYQKFLDQLLERKAIIFDSRSLKQIPFVFYTSEGICYSPSMEHVENMQVLGFESGYSREDALHKLLVTNDWITDCMYATDKILGRKVEI